jgi:cytochrome c oxidase cbb3-type subunit 4
VAFITFIGIVLWAYSGRRRQEFERAARMALDDDHPLQDRSAT